MPHPAPDLRRIAHDSLSLTEAPYVKHYRRGRFRSWNGVGFTASVLPGPGFNFAAVLERPAPALDELLPVARDFFAGCDKGWGVLVEGDAGHPMEDELRGRGWRIDEDEPAFVMPDITVAINPPARPDLAVRRVLTAADEDCYMNLVGAAFGAPPELTAQMTPAIPYLGDPDIALFVGTCDGTDVAGTGYSRSGATAVVWGVATLEAYRGRGFGAALIGAALTHAAARGCTSASLRSGPKSVPLYERVGFKYVCRHRTYAAPADATGPTDPA
jgi:GNAT superfamily N-acetyltransferase